MHDPNQPKYRVARGCIPQKGKKYGTGGGLLKYIAEVDPGPPPLGWRDITPFFWPIPKEGQSLQAYKLLLAKYGYLIITQTVTHKGQTYRRIAVALSTSSGTHNKDKS